MIVNLGTTRTIKTKQEKTCLRRNWTWTRVLTRVVAVQPEQSCETCFIANIYRLSMFHIHFLQIINQVQSTPALGPVLGLPSKPELNRPSSRLSWWSLKELCHYFAKIFQHPFDWIGFLPTVDFLWWNHFRFVMGHFKLYHHCQVTFKRYPMIF